jgi:hypothetical protein
MADGSGPARFQLLFESALQDYGVKTGVPLSQHPLAMDLQSCQSVDDITTLLQRRAEAFTDFQQRDRTMRAIKTTVSILTPLSDVGTLADVIGVVCSGSDHGLFYMSDIFLRHHFHLWQQYKQALLYYWMYVPFPRPFLNIVDVQIHQTANDVISSCNVLADLLESIQNFVDRLKVYTQVSPTPSIDKIVVSLMVELISTLALVTRKLNQQRSREFLLADMVPYSARSSHFGKEFFCGQGHQASSAAAGTSHERRVSE